MISLKHISTLSVFNQTKFSADSTDSSYFLGSDQTQIFQGTPDVKYNDLCYIKCSNLQYTHGHLYGSTEVGEAHVSLTQEEYDALSEEEKNNGKIYLIKESTIPGLIDQLPLATTTTNGLMSAGDNFKLSNLGVTKTYGPAESHKQTISIDYWPLPTAPIITNKTYIGHEIEVLSTSPSPTEPSVPKLWISIAYCSGSLYSNKQTACVIKTDSTTEMSFRYREVAYYI